MGDDIHHHVVPTERCGALNVYIQGDLELAHKDDKDKRCVFLTVHDIGSNHHSMVNFVNHPCMAEIKQRAIFVHVDILGQEDNAESLPADTQFPTMQMIGEDLVNILDTLRIKYVIGLGEGAGANIMLRFAIMHRTRCLGVICIHPIVRQSKFVESIKDKFTNWKLTHRGMNMNAENYLVFHKFGHKIETSEDKASSVEEYKNRLKKHIINPKNLQRYIDAYMKRTDITPQLKNLKCDALVVCGSKSSFSSHVDFMYSNCDKTTTSLLKIDDVGDVLEEAPEKLAQSILLFAKGLGWLTSLTLPGVDRQRTSSIGEDGKRHSRSMSMEEYDKPNIRRLSLTPAE